MTSWPRRFAEAVRERRRVVAGFAILGAIAGLIVSFGRETVYEARATLLVQDPVASLPSIGGDDDPEVRSSPLVVAEAAAIATRESIAERVAERLDTELSVGELQRAVDAFPGAEAELVVEAEADDALLAADLANAYAERIQRELEGAGEERLDDATERLQDGISEAEDEVRVEALEAELARLETLREIVPVAELAREAEVPGGPVSPKPVLSTALGALAGLLAGLLVAMVRSLRERRVHDPEEIGRRLALPVVANVTDTALGHAGGAADGEARISTQDFEAFRVLRTNLASLAREGPVRSLLVTSGLPEEGKTTVSASLAGAAALAGQRVLLVECDRHRPALAERLGIESAPGIADYLRGEVAPRDVLQTVRLEAPESGSATDGAAVGSGLLVCIVSGNSADAPAELLLSARFSGFLDKVTRAYDLVVLDSGPLLAVVDPLELIPQVDGVLVCARADRTTENELRATRDALAKLPDRPAGAVVTGLSRGGPHSYEYYRG